MPKKHRYSANLQSWFKAAKRYETEMNNTHMLLQQMLDARYYADWAEMPSPLETVLHDSANDDPPPPKTLEEQVEVLWLFCKEHLNIEINRTKWGLEALDEEVLKDHKTLEAHDRKLDHLIRLAMQQKDIIKNFRNGKFDEAAQHRLGMAMSVVAGDYRPAKAVRCDKGDNFSTDDSSSIDEDDEEME